MKYTDITYRIQVCPLEVYINSYFTVVPTTLVRDGVCIKVRISVELWLLKIRFLTPDCRTSLNQEFIEPPWKILITGRVLHGFFSITLVKWVFLFIYFVTNWTMKFFYCKFSYDSHQMNQNAHYILTPITDLRFISKYKLWIIFICKMSKILIY